jgi:hypothetical protein
MEAEPQAEVAAAAEAEEAEAEAAAAGQEGAGRAAEASNIKSDLSSSLTVAEPEALGAESEAAETEVASCNVL